MGLEREQEAAVDPQLGRGEGSDNVGGGRMEEGSVGNPAGMGRAQSFLINFDPTEGTGRAADGVTAERETHTRIGMLIGPLPPSHSHSPPR